MWQNEQTLSCGAESWSIGNRGDSSEVVSPRRTFIVGTIILLRTLSYYISL
jgi:hypothetical protein